MYDPRYKQAYQDGIKFALSEVEKSLPSDCEIDAITFSKHEEYILRTQRNKTQEVINKLRQ